MEDETNPNNQTAREQLNEIADHLATHGKYPDGTSEDDVQEISCVLFEQVEDVIETYASDSTLNRQEAEVRALTRFITEDIEPLTKDAVTLLFNVSTEFGNQTESGKNSATNQTVTREEVQQHHLNAQNKIKTATQTVKAETIPNPDTTHVHPRIVWLDGDTVTRLRDQHEPNENTLDDVITRALDEIETRRPLDEVARGYLSARGQENVAQLAIHKLSLERKFLIITAHTNVQDELPEIVTETDAVTLCGRRYYLYFKENPDGPLNHERITLHTSDNTFGMDDIALEDGLETANDYLRELREHGVPLASRTVT